MRIDAMIRNAAEGASKLGWAFSRTGWWHWRCKLALQPGTKERNKAIGYGATCTKHQYAGLHGVQCPPKRTAALLA